MRSIKLTVLLAATALVALAVGVAIGRRIVPPPQPVTLPTAPSPAALAKAVYTPVAFATLAGWADDDLAAARDGLKSSCDQFSTRDPDVLIGQGEVARPAKAWRAVCSGIAAAADTTALRRGLEQNFAAYRVSSSTNGEQGTFTGYYETELNGALVADARFHVPIYGVPHDLVTADLGAFLPAAPPGVPRQIVGRVSDDKGHSKLVPYFTRAQIDAGAVADTADVLIWAEDPVDVHILHIQGSGRVTLPDGTKVRVGFAGSNGQRFQGIGSILIKAGVLTPDGATMDKVRDWLRANPDAAARYMNENARYIFFQRRADDAFGPIGALGVALTPGRSIAVDPTMVPLGAPVWLETADPDGHPLHRLVLAQDTGAAIVGPVRGDFYWGTGAQAFAMAARMKSRGSYAILVPKAP